MNQNPFLQMDYRLLQLNEVEHNGEKHKLSAQSKIVYSYLASLSKSFDTVRPSMQGIADTLGLGSEQVARREIKSLVKAGLISVVERPGTSNAFIVNPVPYASQEAIAETIKEETIDSVPEVIKASESVTAHFTPQMKMNCAQQDKIAEEMKRLSTPQQNEKPIQRHRKSVDVEEIPF